MHFMNLMSQLCSPLIPLAIIMVGILLVCVLAIRWKAQAQEGTIDHFGRTSYLLMGLILLSLLSLGTFLGYSFLQMGGC